jgi:SAM (Sterile alpha motif) domain-containing protein
MDIEAWLRGLGLEQYAPAFRDNDIDVAVLPELTVEDLIGLGITSIGHRRKLLAAISILSDKPTPVVEGSGDVKRDRPGDVPVGPVSLPNIAS